MSIFDDIYKAAVNQDREQLEQILKSNLTLNVLNENGYVVEQLASENKHSAVDLLISLGGGGINAACRGYARAGNIDKVLALLKQGASKDWAVRGATVGGHKDLVTDLLTQGANKDYAVFGAAQGGHKDLVTDLLEQGASKDYAVDGAAAGGQKELMTELLKQGASKDDAVCGAATGGHKDLVSDLLKQGASKDWAVAGAAFGGQKDLVSDLLKQGASKNSAVSGAAYGGQKDLKKWIEENANRLREEGISAKARALLQAAVSGDKTALTELEKMAESIAIAQFCLGHYYLKQISEPTSQATSSTFLSLLKSQSPENLAINAFTKAMKQGQLDAHYYLGYCYEKKNELLAALKHYYLALQANVMVDETQHKLKGLSHHGKAEVVVAACIYQWLLKADRQFLDAAITKSVTEVALFAFMHAEDESIPSTQRLQLLLFVLSQALIPATLQKVQESVCQVIKNIAKAKQVNAYELALIVHQMLKAYAEQRIAIVKQLVTSWFGVSEELRATFLHFEMREPHAPELQIELTKYWQQIPAALKSQLQRLDVDPTSSKKEAVSETSSSSSSSSLSEDYGQKPATPAQQAAQFGQFKVTTINGIEKAEDQKVLANGNTDHQTASTSDYRNQQNDVVAVNARPILSLESLPNVPLHEDELPHPPEGEPEGQETIEVEQSSMESCLIRR